MIRTKLNRKEIEAYLIERYGDICFVCKEPFKLGEEKTLEHWYPQSRARLENWPEEKINHVDNLRLSSKRCNARKGSIIPLDEFNLPEINRPTRAIKYDRPQNCNLCMNGRLLLAGENCELCGSMPQPSTAPRYLQKTPKECPHSGPHHCWCCYIGLVPRREAIQDIIEGPE